MKKQKNNEWTASASLRRYAATQVVGNGNSVGTLEEWVELLLPQADARTRRAIAKALDLIEHDPEDMSESI